MSSDITDSTYDPEKLLEAITIYRNLDLKNYNLEDTIKLFKSFITQFNLVTINLKCSLFRARKIDESGEHRIRKNVSYPSAQDVKKFGRCNNIGESMFYAALDPVTAIKEIKVNPEDKFTLSVYNLDSQSEGIQSTINLCIPREIFHSSKNQKIHSMILNDFIFTEFTRPVATGTEYQYKASCAVTKILLEIPYKDSLLYPSMVDFTKRNIVIKEKAASERLHLSQVLECQIINYSENGNPIISIIREAELIENDENLNLKSISKPETKFELSYDQLGGSSELVINQIEHFLKNSIT